MSDDLLTQLRAYGSHLEAEMTPLDVEDTATPVVVRQSGPSTRPSRSWTYALVAAAAVLLVVLPLLLTRETLPAATTPPNPGPLNGWVAVAAPGVGDQDIFITREGEGLRRIVGSDGDGFDQVCPVFSPDGSKLAYDESDRTGIDPGWIGGPTDVVVVEFDGTADATELFRAASTFRGCVTWSPDSSRVAYVIENPEWNMGLGPSVSINQWLLQVATLDGEVTALFDEFGSHFDVEWSPDGSAIAVRGWGGFTGDQGTLVNFDGVWLVPVDGGSPRLLVKGSGCESQSLTWSPDGLRIAIPGGGGYIRIVSVDGSTDDSIATNEPSDCQAVAWSPDGTRLAYVDNADRRIVLLNPDGSDQVRLPPMQLPSEVEIPYVDGGPIWSPDGTSLLVSVTNRLASMTDAGDVTIQAGKAALVSVSVDPQIPPVILQYWDEGTAYMGGLSWQPVSP